jgi:cytidine deaminase
MTDQELYEAAVAASKAAYAPYSKFLVGAAALMRDGRVVTGVNVENASYPVGICAERCAIGRAVAEGASPGDFEAIGITASPCGACRQWLHEFRFDRVAFMHEGELLVRPADELLPDSFIL